MSSNNKTPLLQQLSITVLLLALALFFSWQLSATGELKEKLEEANEQQNLVFEQSNDVQAKTSEQLEAFLNDLLVLADTDPQAAALVKRYNIRRNQPVDSTSEEEQ